MQVKAHIVAIEIPGGKRNLNVIINAQQVILNYGIHVKQFKFILNYELELFDMYSFNITCCALIFIKAHILIKYEIK